MRAGNLQPAPAAGALEDLGSRSLVDVGSRVDEPCRVVTPAVAWLSLGGWMRAPAAIDVLLEDARRGMDRVQPADLASELTAGALVVDTRPADQRRRDGDLPGAVIIDRNVLEWRLDPTCPHHIPQVSAADVRVIVVCNEGYSSSLAAATLRKLGLSSLPISSAVSKVGSSSAMTRRLHNEIRADLASAGRRATLWAMGSRSGQRRPLNQSKAAGKEPGGHQRRFRSARRTPTRFQDSMCHTPHAFWGRTIRIAPDAITP